MRGAELPARLSALPFVGSGIPFDRVVQKNVLLFENIKKKRNVLYLEKSIFKRSGKLRWPLLGVHVSWKNHCSGVTRSPVSPALGVHAQVERVEAWFPARRSGPPPWGWQGGDPGLGEAAAPSHSSP